MYIYIHIYLYVHTYLYSYFCTVRILFSEFLSILMIRFELYSTILFNCTNFAVILFHYFPWRIFLQKPGQIHVLIHMAGGGGVQEISMSQEEDKLESVNLVRSGEYRKRTARKWRVKDERNSRASRKNPEREEFAEQIKPKEKEREREIQTDRKKDRVRAKTKNWQNCDGETDGMN